MSQIRAKFVVESITHYGPENAQVKMRAIMDHSTPENQRFTKYTPGGTIDITIHNPDAAKHFVPQKAFYIDFTAVE